MNEVEKLQEANFRLQNEVERLKAENKSLSEEVKDLSDIMRMNRTTIEKTLKCSECNDRLRPMTIKARVSENLLAKS